MTRRSGKIYAGGPIDVAQSLAPGTPPTDLLPLTFGVELEMLLTVQRQLGTSDLWLQNDDFGYILDPELREDILEDRIGLAHAARILQRAGCPARLQSTPDYSQWNLVADDSVYPRDPGFEELQMKLRDRVVSGQSWTVAQNVELVSLVFPVPVQLGALRPDPSLLEVERYMTALKGKPGDPFGVFANETCGFHVHIGQDPGTSTSGTAALPLDVLQHLSFMLIQFEPLISSLQPPSRRALAFSPANDMLSSNTMEFRQSRHVCVLGSQLPLLSDIENRIFATDMTVSQLAQLIGESLDQRSMSNLMRYKFVNFTRLTRNNVPQTVEFRQHAGTVKSSHVLQWILFVTSLVRAAEKKSRQMKPATPASPLTPRTALQIHQSLPFPRQQGNKYHVKCESQFDEFERLFDLLESEQETRDYWLGRYTRFNPEDAVDLRLGRPQKEVPQTSCPICVQTLSPTTYRELDEQAENTWDIEDNDED